MRLKVEIIKENSVKINEKVMNIIKKLPLMAFVLGLGFMISMSSFKEEVKAPAKYDQNASYTFQYNGPDFSQASVELASNWVYVADTDLCNGAKVKPCRIQVSEDYVNNPSTSPALKSIINISAEQNTLHGTYYVKGLDDPTGVISNKPN